MPITLAPLKGTAQLARVYNGGEVVGKPPIDVVFVIEWEGTELRCLPMTPHMLHS